MLHHFCQQSISSEMQFTHQKRIHAKKAFIRSVSNTCVYLSKFSWAYNGIANTHTHTFLDHQIYPTFLKCFEWCRYDIIDWFKHFKSFQNAISITINIKVLAQCHTVNWTELNKHFKWANNNRLNDVRNDIPEHSLEQAIKDLYNKCPLSWFHFTVTIRAIRRRTLGKRVKEYDCHACMQKKKKEEKISETSSFVRFSNSLIKHFVLLWY